MKIISAKQKKCAFGFGIFNNLLGNLTKLLYVVTCNKATKDKYKWKKYKF